MVVLLFSGERARVSLPVITKAENNRRDTAI